MNKNTLYRILAVSIIFAVCLSPLTVLDVKAQPRTITVPNDYSTISLAIQNARDGLSIFSKCVITLCTTHKLS